MGGKKDSPQHGPQVVGLELVGLEAVLNKRDEMGIVLLENAQMLCGILPQSPFLPTGCSRRFVCLYHSTGTLASGA